MKKSILPVIPFMLLPMVPQALAQEKTVIRPEQGQVKEVAIDALFTGPDLWSTTATALESTWKGKGFKWNSEQLKDRATIRRQSMYGRLKISAFGGTRNIEEVTFVLKEGKLAEVAISAWNKGDAEDANLSEKKFLEIVDGWTADLSKAVAPKFEDRGKDTASAARAERRMWIGKDMLAQLEYSGGKERIRDPYSGRERMGQNFQGEFIRVRLLPKPTSMIGLNASTGGAASVRRADLAKSVVREPSGDVFIPSVPMVDQGEKGYCAVATASRVFNYYGVPADQHEMAQVAGSGASKGTNPDEMEEAMRRLSGKYKTRFQTELDFDYSSRKYQKFLGKYNRAAKKLGKKQLDTENYIYSIGSLDADVLREVNGSGAALDRFMKIVRENIDKGVPVMWSLQLGLFPENGKPALQVGGGHMRLIIGYNVAKNEIIFSDSWGAGHEKKRIAAPDASAATMGLYLLQPST